MRWGQSKSAAVMLSLLVLVPWACQRMHKVQLTCPGLLCTLHLMLTINPPAMILRFVEKPIHLIVKIKQQCMQMSHYF